LSKIVRIDQALSRTTSRKRGFIQIIVCTLFVLLNVAHGRAYDVEVGLDTSFEAYEVRSPETSVFWARRRLVDNLSLRFVQPLEESKNPALGPKFQAQLQLRLFQEFGDTCFVANDVCVDATNVNDRGVYQPLAKDGLVDVPIGYVEVNRLFERVLIRLGRQLYWDQTGFARIDGIRLQGLLWPFLTVETVGGFLVRNTSIAGSSAFEPQGVPRLKLSTDEQLRAPFIEPPITTYVIGANIDAGDSKIARAGFSYRSLFDKDGLSTRLGGVGIMSQAFDPLQLNANTVFDLLDGSLTDAIAASQLDISDTTWRLSVERHVPRFDRATIWAYFATAPIWEERFSPSWRVTSQFELDGGLATRHADIDNRTDFDVGVDGHVSMRVGRYRFDLSGFGWSGSLGPVWGGDLTAERRFLSWLRIEALVSLWRIEKALRSDLEGISVSETIGVDIRITDNTSFLTDLTHSYSDAIGNRFSLFAFLHMEFWR
jgi:hypothetical protein